MVASITRIRLISLVNFLTGRPKEILKRSLTVLGGAVIAVLLSWFPTVMAFNNQSLYASFDFFLAVLITGMAAISPFFLTKWNFDARSLQTYPFAASKLSSTIIFSGVISWPFLWVALWLASWVYFRTTEVSNILLILIAYAIALFSILIMTRFLTSLTDLLFNTQRKERLRNLLAIALLFVTVPILISIFLSFSDLQKYDSVIDLASSLSFIPPGLIFDSLQLLLAGEVISALPGMLFQLAISAIVAGTAISLTIKQLTSISYPAHAEVINSKLGWFEVMPSTPSGAIGARSMTYWLKDPRYRVSLFAVPIIPFSVIAVLKFAGISVDLLSFIPLPLVLVLIAWVAHNDVANDSTAFWLHVSSGVRGWQDRIGRLVPILFLGLPILFIGTGLSVLISDDWLMAAGFFALGFVALSSGAAVSSVSSVLLPYPATRPNESPFTQPQWQGFGSGFAQSVTLLSSAVLLSPVIWLIVFSRNDTSLDQQLILIGFSVGYGLFLMLMGVFIGGAIYDKRSSKILTLMQVFD